MPNFVSAGGSTDEMDRVEAWLVKKGYKLVPGTGVHDLGLKQYRRWVMEKIDAAPRSSARVCLVWCED
jgi:hypothetical protein